MAGEGGFNPQFEALFEESQEPLPKAQRLDEGSPSPFREQVPSAGAAASMAGNIQPQPTAVDPTTPAVSQQNIDKMLADFKQMELTIQYQSEMLQQQQIRPRESTNRYPVPDRVPATSCNFYKAA